MPREQWVREVPGPRPKEAVMPRETARLLKAAGVETHSPEVALGLMFGSIAHLAAAVWEEWPEAWPYFADAIERSAGELQQIARSGNPRIALDAIMQAQRARGQEAP